MNQRLTSRMIRVTDSAGGMIEMTEKAAAVLRLDAGTMSDGPLPVDPNTGASACCDACASKAKVKSRRPQSQLF